MCFGLGRGNGEVGGLRSWSRGVQRLAGSLERGYSASRVDRGYLGVEEGGGRFHEVLDGWQVPLLLLMLKDAKVQVDLLTDELGSTHLLLWRPEPHPWSPSPNPSLDTLPHRLRVGGPPVKIEPLVRP